MSDEERERLEALERLLAEALDALEAVINQACARPVPGGRGVLDSQALSAYAEGMRVLAGHGRLVIEDEFGRRVIGHWPESEGPK